MTTLHSGSPRKIQLNHRGFTLVELLLVLAILAILAGLVYPQITKRAEGARITAAKVQIATFTTALQTFAVDNGSFPKGKDGLAQLLQRPANTPNWQGPYLDKLPADPWSHGYVFEFPGKHPPVSFDLMSAGPDGQPGTADEITNWK
jgi:general secretion pathway protein G